MARSACRPYRAGSIGYYCTYGNHDAPENATGACNSLAIKEMAISGVA